VEAGNNVSKVKQGTRHGYIDVDTLKLGEYCFGNSTDLNYLGGREIVQEEEKISVYPNPASHTCTVEVAPGVQAEPILKINSTEGKLMKQIKLQPGKNQIELTSLEKGNYLFTVWEGKKKIFTKKMLIE
jgi:hypothetical protein